MAWQIVGEMDEPIDVWNTETFDEALRALLDEHADTIRDYLITDRRQFLEREASRSIGMHTTNPHAGLYQWVVEHVVMPAMGTRTIRAWHYTRLTDDEVERIQRGGIHVATLTTIRQRLDALVSAGQLSAQTADVLFEQSPFHHEDKGGKRSGMFWMTSHPVPINHSGVEPLLGSWGGESIYFWLRDDDLQKLVAGIGRPRVIEIAVPLSVTRHAYAAAKAVVATYARTLGCEPDNAAFDLYATSDLGPEAVMSILTEGEPDFSALARGYSTAYRQADDGD